MFPARRNQTYAVGTTTFTIIDDSRKEVLGDAGGPRKIPVRLYYPVLKEQTGNYKKAAYVSERKKTAIEKMLHIKMGDIQMDSAALYEDAPWIEGQRFPLFLFSHGYNTYVEANTFLCAEIAASGYIVASVGHAQEAIINEYADGSFDLYDKKINKMMYKRGVFRAIRAQSKIMKMKGSPEEIEAAFRQFQVEHTPYLGERIDWWREDMLAALKQIKSDYNANLDLSHGVSAGGHSYGGATAYYLCQTCDEISCGINIDGALFGNYQNMVMKKPFFQISCKENQNVELRPMLHREAPLHVAVFENMKHNGFMDMKFLLPKKMLVGGLDAEVLHENLTAFHVTFLDKYLKGLSVTIHEPTVPEITKKDYL